ncbi:MAG: helix-turn-helix domain-containing protein [Clostridia bacterium]
MTFSEKIKELRKEKGVNQKVASGEMEMAISSLRNYENGRLPDTEQLRKIQNYYNVPYEYLLNDECTTKKYSNMEISRELGLSDKAIATLKYFKNLDEMCENPNKSEHNVHISTNTIINKLLNDTSFFETIAQYIMLEIINKDEIENMKDYLNISDELYEYTRLSNIFVKILEVKENILKELKK